MRVLKVNKENTKNILSDLLKRSPNNYDQYAGTVQGILDEIKEKGDEALFAYTEKFDKCKLTKDTIQVTEEEIKAAYEKVDDSLVEVIRKSLVNIREYHEKQKRKIKIVIRRFFDSLTLYAKVTRRIMIAFIEKLTAKSCGVSNVSNRGIPTC